MATIVTKSEMLEKLKKEFNETEFAVFEGMLQGESVKDTSENFAISIAEAAAHRRLIYEVLENYVDIANHKKEKQTRIIAWFNSLPGQEGPIEAKHEKNAVSESDFKKTICSILGISEEHSQESLIELLKDWKRSDEEFAKLVNDNAFLQQLKGAIVVLPDDTKCECSPHIKDYIEELKQELATFKKKYHEKKLENFFGSVEKNAAGGVRNFSGQFYVYNPSHGQPRKIYNSYDKALCDAKDVAGKTQQNVFVLQILSLCSPRIDVIDKTQPQCDELTEDDIPF